MKINAKRSYYGAMILNRMTLGTTTFVTTLTIMSHSVVTQPQCRKSLTIMALAIKLSMKTLRKMTLILTALSIITMLICFVAAFLLLCRESLF